MAFNSKNAFALLGDEDGPAPVKAPVKAPEAAAPAPARNIPGSGRGAPRGGAGAANRGPRRNAEGGAAATDDAAPEGKELRDRRPRPEGGRGRGRGGRGGRGRQFDRHSATDRVDSEKNLRQGWGGEDGERDLKAEQDAAADAKAENKPEANGEASEWDAPATEAAPAAAAAADGEAAPAEEVDNTKTYDEYLADLAAKKATLAAGKGAGPREVEADKWEGFGAKVVKSQSGGDEYFVAGGKASGSNKTREKKQKEILEIEQTFNRPPVAGRGGRGGPRGGPREGGRGGRGARGGARGGRGGRGGSSNVNLDDQRAFPSLS